MFAAESPHGVIGEELFSGTKKISIRYFQGIALLPTGFVAPIKKVNNARVVLPGSASFGFRKSEQGYDKGHMAGPLIRRPFYSSHTPPSLPALPDTRR